MKPQKDYSLRGWTTLFVVLLVLGVVSFIPPVTIGGVSLRRANIFSDLYTFDEIDNEASTDEVVLFDEAEFAVDLEAVTQQIEADTLPHEVQRSFCWQVAPDSASRPAIRLDSARYVPKLTPIEDFSPEGRFATFCDSLLRADRTVRIAVFGDSFIEGDIMTADLRERLQQAYGGRGTGFAPMASPLTNFRRTVKTTSKGWTTYNIMQHKTTPEPLKQHYFVSGWVSRPSAGASTRWEATTFRRGLDSCSRARILFIAPEESHIELILNDSLHQDFTVEGADVLREVVVENSAIHALEFKVHEGAEKLIGYGALFEDKGVEVDNYSVRSNNGQALFRTNPTINAQANDLIPYDLIILQYGLNIMQKGVLNYTSYGAQIEKMIAYARQCFPTAAVLVMGVSDRSVKEGDGFQTMDAIPYMTECQRTAAANQQAAFWPTFDAMQAQGGMANFVSKGWAGKDYTHINYAGGRRVAWALFDAINAEAIKADERHRRRLEAERPIIDSVKINELQILPPADSTHVATL